MKVCGSFCFLMLSLFSVSVNAQQWGESIKVSSYNQASVLMPFGEGYIGIHENFKSRFVSSEALLQLDANLAVTRSEDVNFKTVLKGLKYWDAVVLDQQIVVLATLWDKKAKTQEIYGVPVRSQDLSFGVPVSIAKVGGLSKSESFRHDRSLDGSKLLITALELTEGDSVVTSSATIVAVDAGLNKLWTSTLSIPEPLQLMEVLGAGISNEGVGYVARALYIDDAHYFHRSSENYSAELAVIGATGTTRMTSIPMDGRFMKQAKVISTADGKAVVAAIEGMHEHPVSAGLAFVTYDPDSTAITAHEFYDAGVQHQYYQLKDAFEVRPGDYAMVTQFYAQSEQELFHDDGTVKKVVTNYTNNEILLACFNGANITTVHVIPLQNNSTDDRSMYAGYTYRVDGEFIQFIFNDQPENEGKKLGDPLTPVKEEVYGATQLVSVAVNVAAEEVRKVIFKPTGDGMITQPCHGLVVGDELIVTGINSKGRAMQFGRMGL